MQFRYLVSLQLDSSPLPLIISDSTVSLPLSLSVVVSALIACRPVNVACGFSSLLSTCCRGRFKR